MQKNDKGWTSSTFAAADGRRDTAELLLQHGADVNAKTDKGWTALMCTAWNGHRETAELLTTLPHNLIKEKLNDLI